MKSNMDTDNHTNVTDSGSDETFANKTRYNNYVSGNVNFF
jgi:hypothetical protein